MCQEPFTGRAQVHRENIEPGGQLCLGENHLFIESPAALYVEVDCFKIIGLGKKIISEDEGKTHDGHHRQAGYDFQKTEHILDPFGPSLCGAVFIKIFAGFFMYQQS